MVEHSSVVHMIIHQQSIIRLHPSDVSMQNGSISFDASGLDLFVPLAMGCSVVPAQKRTKEDAAAFLRQMVEYKVPMNLLSWASEIRTAHAAWSYSKAVLFPSNVHLCVTPQMEDELMQTCLQGFTALRRA